MRRDAERWLAPCEAAAELGVSVKALRVYEREGLVTPARTASRWRAYGPAQIARMHLIIVLRDLGLSLKGIKALLDEGPPSLSQLLTTQQEALEAKRRKISGAISLLMDARLRIAAGQTLSPDDLTHLSRETVMQTFENYADVEARLEGYLKSHMPPGQFEEIKAGAQTQMAEAGLVKEDLAAEVAILIGEMRKLMVEGDPDSEAAKTVARRWRAVTRGIKKPDPEVREAWMRSVDGAMADPTLGPQLPFDPQVLAFMQKVTEGMKARGELA